MCAGCADALVVFLHCRYEEAAKDGHFWTDSASAQELLDYTIRSLAGLDEDFIEPIRATPVTGILQPALRMRDMVPPPLPKGRVTLLGDAVHPMVPCKNKMQMVRVWSIFDLLIKSAQFVARVETWLSKTALSSPKHSLKKGPMTLLF